MTDADVLAGQHIAIQPTSLANHCPSGGSHTPAEPNPAAVATLTYNLDDYSQLGACLALTVCRSCRTLLLLTAPGDSPHQGHTWSAAAGLPDRPTMTAAAPHTRAAHPNLLPSGHTPAIRLIDAAGMHQPTPPQPSSSGILPAPPGQGPPTACALTTSTCRQTPLLLLGDGTRWVTALTADSGHLASVWSPW